MHEGDNISNVIEVSRFENLHRLLRVTAYVLRFIKNCRIKRLYNLRKQRLDGQIHSKVESIAATEISSETKLWIKNIQYTEFSREIGDVQNQKRSLPLVKQLRLFLDDDGILRCEG
jgi:hypothetical protein